MTSKRVFTRQIISILVLLVSSINADQGVELISQGGVSLGYSYTLLGRSTDECTGYDSKGTFGIDKNWDIYLATAFIKNNSGKKIEFLGSTSPHITLRSNACGGDGFAGNVYVRERILNPGDYYQSTMQFNMRPGSTPASPSYQLPSYKFVDENNDDRIFQSPRPIPNKSGNWTGVDQSGDVYMGKKPSPKSTTPTSPLVSSINNEELRELREKQSQLKEQKRIMDEKARKDALTLAQRQAERKQELRANQESERRNAEVRRQKIAEKNIIDEGVRKSQMYSNVGTILSNGIYDLGQIYLDNEQRNQEKEAQEAEERRQQRLEDREEAREKAEAEELAVQAQAERQKYLEEQAEVQRQIESENQRLAMNYKIQKQEYTNQINDRIKEELANQDLNLGIEKELAKQKLNEAINAEIATQSKANREKPLEFAQCNESLGICISCSKRNGISDNLDQPGQVVVSIRSVLKGASAQKSGMIQGATISAFKKQGASNFEKIESRPDFCSELLNLKIGSSLVVRINGRDKVLSFKAGD